MRAEFIPVKFISDDNTIDGVLNLHVTKHQFDKTPGATPIEKELYDKLKDNPNFKSISYNPKAKIGERLKIEGLRFQKFNKLNIFNLYNYSLPLNELLSIYKKLKVSNLAIEKMTGCLFNKKFLSEDDEYKILQLPRVVSLDNVNKKTYLYTMYDPKTKKSKIIGLYQTDGVEPGLILGELSREQLEFDIRYKEIVDRHTKTINADSTAILAKIKALKQETYNRLKAIAIQQANSYTMDEIVDALNLDDEKRKIFNINELMNVENFK